MTSAELADRIINFQTHSRLVHPMLTLSDLLQRHHDAVVEECAELLVRASKRALKSERKVLLVAVDEIRALKGCV